MSNDSAPECLSHKDNRNLQTRLDYMLLYRSESKAKIIRVLETWTNTKYAECFKGTADSKEQKSEPPIEDLWITMSYDQFSLFVYGTIRHDTIKQQVDELVALKHIQRRVHPVYPYGSPQYLLNREIVQKSLDELEIPANLFDLSPMLLSPGKKRTPQERYPQGGGKKPTRDPGKIPPGTGETSYPSNNLSKNTKKHTENEGTHSAGKSEDAAAFDASASAHTQSSSQFVFQIQGAERFYYHDFCIHEQDRGINDGLTLIVKNLNDVPRDAECQICYKPVYGPHGHNEMPAQSSQDEPYRPNFNATRESENHSHIASDTPQGDINGPTDGDTDHALADLRIARTHAGSSSGAPGEHPQRSEQSARGTASAQQQAAQSVASQSAAASGGYEKAEQATLAAPTPASAKVEPRAARSRTLGKRASEYKIYFTIEGSSFRGWYEEIFGIQLDETAANARACNALGKRESVTYENIKLVAKEIDVNKWVKDNNVAVTVQDLANDNSNLRWEKWLQSAQKRAKRAVPPPAPTIEENPYSFAAQLARNPLPTLKGATV